MKFTRAAISILAVGCIFFSVLSSGCGWMDRSEKEIISTVTAYIEEIRSGSFAENRYLSAFAKDDPFSTMTFKDEAATRSMDTALRQIEYKVVEASGNKSDRTGICTVFMTVVDIEKIQEDLKDEWVTAESLDRAITSTEAPTYNEEVILFMEYDTASDTWIISNSAAMAVVLGVPYSKINLFSKAGLPEDAFVLFMDALKTGEAEKINPFIKTYSSFGLLYPEDTESSVRKAYFAQMNYEIQDVDIIEDTCEIKVLLDYTDMQAIADQLNQDASLICEMYKYLFTALLTEHQAASLDTFRELNTQLWLTTIDSQDTARLQETFVFKMVTAEEGSQWRITGLPEFMTTVYASGEEASDDVNFSAVGMAVIELCEEGVITEQQRDEVLLEFDLQELKYSSRQVVATYVRSAMFDVNSYKEVQSFDAKSTEKVGVGVSFDKDWPEMVIYIMLYSDGAEEPEGYFSVKAGLDIPKQFVPQLDYMGAEKWPGGKYRLEIFLADWTPLASLSFEVK